MFWKVAVTTAALASRACAEIRPLSMDHSIEVRAVDVLERNYEDVANRYIEKRRSAATVDGEWIPKGEVSVNADGTINMTAWELETTQKCTDALSHLDQASNPSGTCICYNLPSLDAKTGVFEADLRLYKVSEPNGVFSGIPPQNIQVGLSFNGASVSPVSADKIRGTIPRRDVSFEVDWSRLQKRVLTPQILQTYLFVGQIDQARMAPPMSMSQLEALVMPTLTLTGVNAAGQTVTTNVSSNEAAFITGVFSKEVIRSDLAVAQAAVDEVVAQLKNGTVAFVLPGVQIMIFPIGLVITSTWLLIGLAFVGFGTYERIGYADSYRRRRAMAGDTAKRI
ncbi:hypothetical protein CH063_13033 [Colletotrichum higginsianum]|uniref:Uncharacterized protein n=2 Tax=Colletotrichum higginsianum TaxID=80884 RepID=H1VSS4_COLHI|nr:hypothetical protein CH63R_05234 [Colletotrichum higginsianum IMI 349063]OBR12938.1 hypothetical protein CH63R_05234 [Colletotrichum higginsianum IMI 349063]TIC99169.1 hypothetical protein CH35J_004995 [Colletotrichum higginsianum]CCF43282.1 hypothetical protein CH063_13033 [Colletotrichum higginsianum]